MIDVSLVPEAAWREAQRRAEVIRPLVQGERRSRLVVRAAAVTLGLSERQIYTLLQRCLACWRLSTLKVTREAVGRCGVMPPFPWLACRGRPGVRWRSVLRTR